MVKTAGVFLGAVALLVFGLAGPLMAADADAKTTGQFQPNLVRSSQFIGMEVHGADNQSLGKVSDVVLNRRLDRAIVALVQFSAADNKLIAVPFQAFQHTKGQKALKLNVTKEKLQQAKAFDANNPPDMTGAQWLREQRELWGVTLMDDQYGATQRPGERVGERPENGARVSVNPRSDVSFDLRRVSKLQGLNVQGQNGKELGQMKEIVLDMHEGRPVFGVISYSDKLAPIPWSELQIGVDGKDVARVNIDQAKLDPVAFQDNNWPNMEDQQTLSRIYQHFGEEPYWEVFGYVGEDGAGAQRGLTTEGWQADSQYGKLYSKDQEVTISGTVQSVGTFKPAARSVDGLRLRVQLTQQHEGLGNVVTVHGGPMPYVMNQNFAVKSGDQVKIVGSKATMNGRTFIIARQITSGNQTLTLRDENGQPRWNVDTLKTYIDRFNQRHGDYGMKDQKSEINVGSCPREG